MKKLRVYQAEPYRSGAMGSLGNAAYMLLRQHQFPDTYDERDRLIGADQDRIIQRDYEKSHEIITRHIGSGEIHIEQWVREQFPEKVIAFFAELLPDGGDAKQWAGFRLMGSVHRGNGHPVYTLELFAKHSDSDTEVYDGMSAPNVKRPEPSDRYEMVTW